MIQSSGVPVSIGTDDQLDEQLPPSFRKHRSRWVGVTVVNSVGLKGAIGHAVVAVRIAAIERMIPPVRAVSGSDLTAQIDRVLIHEIYGHLAPVIAARDASLECPDQRRPGELQPCVKLREARIAHELSRYLPAPPVLTGASRMR